MSTSAYVSVHAFAQLVNRPPNSIYNLINKGNQYRKLKAAKINGVWAVELSEVDEFPFNEQRYGELKSAKTVDYLGSRIVELAKENEALNESLRKLNNRMDKIRKEQNNITKEEL